MGIGEESPVGLAGHTVLVAHPAAAGTAVGVDDGLRLQLVDEGKQAVELIVMLAVDAARLACAAVVAVAAVGAVKPYLEEVLIIEQQLIELVAIIFNVSGLTVVGLMAVPRR